MSVNVINTDSNNNKITVSALCVDTSTSGAYFSSSYHAVTKTSTPETRQCMQMAFILLSAVPSAAVSPQPTNNEDNERCGPPHGRYGRRSVFQLLPLPHQANNYAGNSTRHNYNFYNVILYFTYSFISHFDAISPAVCVFVEVCYCLLCEKNLGPHTGPQF